MAGRGRGIQAQAPAHDTRQRERRVLHFGGCIFGSPIAKVDVCPAVRQQGMNRDPPCMGRRNRCVEDVGGVFRTASPEGRKTNRVRAVEAMPAILLAASVRRRFAAAVSPRNGRRASRTVSCGAVARCHATNPETAARTRAAAPAAIHRRVRDGPSAAASSAAFR